MPNPPYPKALQNFPILRQSVLARFDECGLTSYFDRLYRKDFTAAAAARGIIWHRAAAKMLRELAAHGEDHIEVDVALAILLETLRQADVPTSEVVNIPMREVHDLAWMTKKFAYETHWNTAALVDIERRLTTTISYPADGGCVERTVSGQLDALFTEGEELDRGVVLDWKAQPVDARVLTPHGWRTIGDIAVGDLVIGRDGKPTEVLGVYPQGIKEVYDVELTDGAHTQCCDEHLWTVRKSGSSHRTVRPLRYLRERLRTYGYWQLPTVVPVQFASSMPLPVDPYLLGALLGDGTLSVNGSIQFTTADPEMIEAVETALPVGVAANREDDLTWRLAAARKPNPLRQSLTALGLTGKRSWEKSIPPAYLFASQGDRLALLRGLMDTDGSIDADAGRISFCSASQTLAKDVQFLVRSLGGRATLKTWTTGRERETHTVYFRMPMVPFTLSRKAARWQPSKESLDRGIRAITPAGVKECRCIKVAAPDGLYVTDDFILTHNTSWWLPPPSEISEQGFFQQRFYALLVLRQWPHLQSVTLREFYPRFSEYREATLFRDQMLEIEDGIAAVVERFDRSVQEDLWKPSPGTACSYCARPTACPIFPTARRQGRIGSPEEAGLVAAQVLVADAAIKQSREALKSWAAEHGPVPVKDAKAGSVIGHREMRRVNRPSRERLEQAIECGESLDDLYRETVHTRFDVHIPNPDLELDAEDDDLLDRLTRSVSEARERQLNSTRRST